MSEQPKRGEELFDRLNENRKKRRRKIIRTVLCIAGVLTGAAVAAVMHLRQ